jgi:hypothetical protein
VFSHKPHAPLKLSCTYCHTTASTSDHAGFPKPERCKSCHAGMAISAIPSQRIYRVKDYVFFSHSRHKVECSVCHGDVMAMTAVTRVRGTDMKACVDCHKARNAPVACPLCHELGQ